MHAALHVKSYKLALLIFNMYTDPNETQLGLSPNLARGTLFGADVTKAFLTRNKLQCLVRSHQVQMDGYTMLHDGLCISVFSAPNYCGRVGNLGAVVRYDKPDSMQPSMVQFAAADVRDASSDYSRW